MKQIIIRAQWGLGDSIYARPFVRIAASMHELFLETPWPELFSDLPVRFVLRERKLRTQMKNVLRQPRGRWVDAPRDALMVDIGYNGEDLRTGSIVSTLERKYSGLGVRLPASPAWDLPDLGPCPVKTDRPIALVRPCTQRREWLNAARNPIPSYVNWVAEKLKKTHHVVVVADLEGTSEWLDGPVPAHHQALLAGQLDVRQLLSLARHADVLVGGVGWIVPAAIALRTRAFVLLGGHGAHNHPSRITDPRMDLSRITFAMPEKFCLCSNMNHACDKRIRSLPEQWSRFESTVLHSSKPAPRDDSRGGRSSASGTIPLRRAPLPTTQHTGSDISDRQTQTSDAG